MDPGAAPVPSLTLSTRIAGSTAIGELRGELDLMCSPVLRDQLLSLLRAVPADLFSTCPR